MVVPFNYIKESCHENNDSSLIRNISSKIDSFNLISSGSNSITKPYHDFWHEKVRHKTDSEIWAVDNPSLSESSWQWIKLNRVAYNPHYSLETYKP